MVAMAPSVLTPCMCRAVCRRPSAGPGLPGLTAAFCGGKVVLTDMEPTLSEICAPNAEANLRTIVQSKSGGSVSVAKLVWGEPITAVAAASPRLVLCGDIVFDESHFEALSNTICDLLPADAAACGGGCSSSSSYRWSGGQWCRKCWKCWKCWRARERERGN